MTAFTDTAGNDHFNGMDGNAPFRGTAGRDCINGGADFGQLTGAAGRDTLTGGAGPDLFIFDLLETSANRDQITDFSAADDRIALSAEAFAGLVPSDSGKLSPAPSPWGSRPPRRIIGSSTVR